MPSEEWINKESLRFCLEGSDELAVDMALVNLPYKVLDEEGTILAQGNIPKNGRLPRVISDHNKTVRLEVGQQEWQKISAEAASNKPEEDTASKEMVPSGNDPYISRLRPDFGEHHLSKEQLTKLVGDVQGEA